MPSYLQKLGEIDVLLILLPGGYGGKILWVEAFLSFLFSCYNVQDTFGSYLYRVRAGWR